MQTREIEMGRNKYLFVNETINTRNGFGHKSVLFRNGIELSRYTAHYLNRTWEAYTYQSAMLRAVDEYRQYEKNLIIKDYKINNKVKRLTAKHVDNITEMLENDQRQQELNQLLDKLHER